MNNAEVLIKFKGDTSQDQIKQEEEKLKSLEKTGKIAMAGLTTAVDVAVGKLISMGIEYNGQVETYLTRLKTLTGSSEKAGQILEQIKKDALSTPFEVSGLVQGQSLLLSTGLSAEQARQDILNLGNAISASGGGNEELQRMAVNLQQIKNVGKASALDIKQFAYAGIDIYGLLADSMGITRQEASDLDVTYEMLSEALAKASGEGGRYAGAMEAQSKTYKGSMSNLQESFQVLTGELSEGLFNAIKDLIPHLTNMFDWLSKNKDIVLAIAIPLLTFINIITGFLIIQKVIGLFSALWAVLMANPIIAIIALITALVAGFMYLWNNCEGFRNFFIGIWEAIKSAVHTGVEFIVNLFVNLHNRTNEVAQRLKEIMITPFVKAYEGIKFVLDKLWNIIKWVVDKVFGAFNDLPGKMSDIGKNIINGIVNGIKGVKDKAVNAVKDVGKNLLSGIKGVLGIHSPSTEFGIVGKYSVLGYTEALESMQDDVDKAINSTFGLSPSLTNSAMLHYSPNVVVNNEVNVSQDPLGQMVSNIKSFSGGAKNDYNFGLGN